MMGGEQQMHEVLPQPLQQQHQQQRVVRLLYSPLP